MPTWYGNRQIYGAPTVDLRGGGLVESPNPFFVGPGQYPHGYNAEQAALFASGGMHGGAGGAGGMMFPTYPNAGTSPGMFPGGKTLAPGPGGVLPMPGTGNGHIGYGNDVVGIPREPPSMISSGGTVPIEVGGGGGFAGVGNPTISGVVGGLLTPGLVPDILRQSAETAAGRGIGGGSPAGYSTAVRMSEQDYLTRLALADRLLSGEAGRELPYQITPYQKAQLDLERQRLQNEQLGNLAGALSRRGGGGGGGYGAGGGGDTTPTGSQPIGNMLGNYWTQPQAKGPFSSGPSGLGRTPTTLDDVYDWLGFGNFGSQGGDWTNPPQTPEDFYDFVGLPQEPQYPPFPEWED